MEALDYKNNLSLVETGWINNHKAHGCIHPITLEGEKFPCGKCALCQAKRRRDWSFRLGVELNHSVSAYFVTMTYDEANMPRVNGVGTLHKKDCQLFLKRLRNAQRKLLIQYLKCEKYRYPYIKQSLWNRLVNYKIDKYGFTDLKQVRYYLVGEYGDRTRRPHYHALIFNLMPSIKENIANVWRLGSCKVGTVTPSSINYCTKYMLKQQFGKKDWREKPFTLMSRRPAIGYQYLDKNSKYHKDNETITVRNVNGNFQAMPRFYRDRIWIEKETRKQVLEKCIQEYREKQEKEILRLKALGQLTPELEISKIKDIQRRKETILKEINTF